MQVARYLSTWFHCPAGSSVAKYLVGQSYPLTDETALHVEQGIAELVDEPDQAPDQAPVDESVIEQPAG